MDDIEGTQDYKNLAAGIRQWLDETQGYFLATDIDRYFSLTTRKQKQDRWVNLRRLYNQGKIEKHPTQDGKYRRVDKDLEEVDWRNADVNAVLPLSWVFGLESLVNIYPRNLVVAAGSPDSGKTALLLNFVADNMMCHDIALFNSEMGAQEFKLRLSKFPFDLSEWRFDVYERSSNFADVIFPDKINIIDYLEIDTDFYAVGMRLKEIYRKLNNGIAIVALQKKRGAELGRGAEFGLELARMYLSLDNGVMTIVKAKNWADPLVNPNRKQFKFNLVDGCKFSKKSE